MAKLELALKFEMKKTIIAIEALKSMKDQIESKCIAIIIRPEQAQAFIDSLVGDDGLQVVKFEAVTEAKDPESRAVFMEIYDCAIDEDHSEAARLSDIKRMALAAIGYPTPTPADWDGKIST